MISTAKGCEMNKIGFYQPEKKEKNWHRYADILIPLITIPLLIFIALYLNDYIVHDVSAKLDPPEQWRIFILSMILLGICLSVFVYMCIRLNAILCARSRLRIPMMRSSKSNASFLRSINSDLQYSTPFNNYPATYESIIFDVPPFYVQATKKVSNV